MADDSTALVARRMRAAREFMGLTRAEVARRLGISPEAWARWEDGRVPSFLWVLADIAPVLGTTVDDLAEGVQLPDPPTQTQQLDALDAVRQRTRDARVLLGEHDPDA